MSRLDDNLEKYKIKYFTAIFYSIVFLLLGLSFFPSKIITGLLSIVIAFLIFPPTETYVKKKYKLNLSKDVRAPIILFLFLLISMSLASDKKPISKQQDKTQESSQTTTSVNPFANEQRYKVTKVVDGDTIVALVDGKEERIRIIGIDTPETADPSKPIQCFGKEAKAKASDLLLNNEVYLISDTTQDNKDKYGRLLRYVFLPLDSIINQDAGLLLISEGFAREYTYDKPYKYQEEYRSAEQTAKRLGNGLWDLNACN